MKIGLFFGSFNPIHVGHLIIANYMVEFTDLEKVWFVVSPHNPLKQKSSLLADSHRLALVNCAIQDDQRFVASNIEFRLPQPSYTVNTLAHLTEKYPNCEFVLIMGSDGLETFNRWKNFEYLSANFKRYIYPRANTPAKFMENVENCLIVDAPRIEISSTFIRQSINENKDVRYFLNENVWKYIDEMNFYRSFPEK